MNFNPNRKRSDLHSDIINTSFKYKKYLKKFIVGRLKPLGRSKGTIVMAHKGGGVKNRFRYLGDYKEQNSGIIRSIEYDPNRSSNIGLMQYKNGVFCNRVYSSKNYNGQILRTYDYKNHKNIK